MGVAVRDGHKEGIRLLGFGFGGTVAQHGITSRTCDNATIFYFLFLKHRFIVLADATGHKYINSGYLRGRSHLTYVRDCSQCVQTCVYVLCSGWVWAGHFGKGAENGGLRVFKELA